MTYDPNIGRWLEEDPIGLDAGDANSYRFVGNNPVNEVDPSGLKADFVSKGQLNASMPGFTGAEAAALMLDLRLAIEKLDKALSMLTDHWDELEGLSTFTPLGGKPFISLRYRTLASKYSVPYGGWGVSGVYESTVRKEYIILIRQVLDPLRKVDHCTAFKPDRSPTTANGRKAYVIYIRYSRIHDPYYQSFFRSPAE